MTTFREDVERVVDALLAWTAPLTQILDHMARAAEPLPPEKAPEVLRELLCQTLQPLYDDARRRLRQRPIPGGDGNRLRHPFWA